MSWVGRDLEAFPTQGLLGFLLCFFFLSKVTFPFSKLLRFPRWHSSNVPVVFKELNAIGFFFFLLPRVTGNLKQRINSPSLEKQTSSIQWTDSVLNRNKKLVRRSSRRKAEKKLFTQIGRQAGGIQTAVFCFYWADLPTSGGGFSPTLLILCFLFWVGSPCWEGRQEKFPRTNVGSKKLFLANITSVGVFQAQFIWIQQERFF